VYGHPQFPALPLKLASSNDSQESATKRFFKRGQVAQVVERSPEKAGVGGSTPSLATIIPKNLAELWLT
jgi:hypothetical protein